MKCRYMSIECRIGYRRTYGIAAVDTEDGEKIILRAIVDVSDEREKADRLADRCNREKVNLRHLRSIITKYIEMEE